LRLHFELVDNMNYPKDIRNSGLRVTTSRLRILELFHDSKEKHLSAEDIYCQLRDEKMDVGLATIYRVLMQFSEANILIRRHFESGSAVFELNQGEHHDHLVCISCGKVEEFVDDEIETRQQELAKQRGFVIHQHSLSLYGHCSDCVNQNAKKSK